MHCMCNAEIYFTLRGIKMSEYVLSCCSTADLTEEHFIERNISYVCFHFNLDGI